MLLWQVTRLNIYETTPTTLTPEEIRAGRETDIVALGSPSAVSTWVKQIGTLQ